MGQDENINSSFDRIMQDVVRVVSYEEAGFTEAQVDRLALRGIKIELYRLVGEAELIKMNLVLSEGSIAHRVGTAVLEGEVETDSFNRLLEDARSIEDEEAYRKCWLEYI
jgi:hypothetical protein